MVFTHFRSILMCLAQRRCLRYFALIVVAEMTAILALWSLQRQREMAFFDQKITQYEQAYQVSLDAYGLVAQALHDELINRPEVIDIFEQAYTATPAKQAVLRQQLYERLNPTYQNLQKLNLKQLHFHLPDSTSFLRFHRPEKFGDPLIDVRYSVKLANTALTPVQGFEEGRIYNGFRYVFPLFANEDPRQHIGSVETSLSFQALRERLERTSPGHYALLLRRAVVDAKVNQDEKQSNYLLSDLSDEFVYETSLQTEERVQRDRAYTSEQIAQINQTIRDRVAPKLQRNQPFALAVSVASSQLQSPQALVVFLPLRNLQGEVVAYLVAYEPDATIAAYYHGFYIQIVGVTLSIFLLMAFIYTTNRGKESAKRHQVEMETTLNQLKQVQSHIQREKMASLGQLVGGIAHELNNPISFIYGNSLYAQEYAEELINLIELYQQHTRVPHPEIQARSQQIDLDFIRNDLFKLLDSMKTGAERINKIVSSLRNFSRLQESGSKIVNVHEGLESTLALLETRLHPGAKRPSIQVVKQYGILPEIACYPGDLNQAFLSILSNAIESFEPWETFPAGYIPKIEIETCVRALPTSNPTDNSVLIRIVDNGKGIPPEILPQIFDPFFTTKPVGQATGLGLSVSYQVIVERHGGRLEVRSRPEQGTAVWIELPTGLPCARSPLTPTNRQMSCVKE